MTDLYRQITDKIVSQIEANPGSWLKPWAAARAEGMPFNATTSARYRGVNVLLLWNSAAVQGFSGNQWASYKQWAAHGAQVRRGEKGTMIVYYGTTAVKDRSDPSAPEQQIRFLKYSHVFNACQVDGYTVDRPAMPALAERLTRAEQFVSATGASVRYGSDRAFYAPGPDMIAMPDFAQFTGSPTSTPTEAAYGTLLHELVHWTGHERRCARQFGKRFGDDAYAAEELVAELGAAFLCASLGISADPRQDHAQYLASWLKIMKGDRKAIFTAASKASDAADFLGKFSAEPVSIAA